jgi:hypothetical protein
MGRGLDQGWLKDLVRDGVKRKFNRPGDPDDHGRCPDCIKEGRDYLIPFIGIEIDHVGGQKTMRWSQSGTTSPWDLPSYRRCPLWQVRREAAISEPVCHVHHRLRTLKGNWRQRQSDVPSASPADWAQQELGWTQEL